MDWSSYVNAAHFFTDILKYPIKTWAIFILQSHLNQNIRANSLTATQSVTADSQAVLSVTADSEAVFTECDCWLWGSIHRVTATFETVFTNSDSCLWDDIYRLWVVTATSETVFTGCDSCLWDGIHRLWLLPLRQYLKSVTAASETGAWGVRGEPWGHAHQPGYRQALTHLRPRSMRSERRAMRAYPPARI